MAPQRIALVDLLDRVLATGVVVTGDVTISIADVDLVYISLQALISSVRAGGPGPPPPAGMDQQAGRS
ncbi:gas vesicle protein [Glycomyces luteolus]|uniref:Gas vesicle protein n=2 Tax=Glycomyces luteolus TaxID=2670330 RepID=A0A9X3SQZ5_9ACTN|nr:gas vesicle protein [Glycomyces luteolus]